jgi:hypothetical protein
VRVMFLDFDGVLSPASGDTAVLPFVWLPILAQLLAPWPECGWRCIRRGATCTSPTNFPSSWVRWARASLEPSLAALAPRRFFGSSKLNPVITNFLVLDDAPSEFPADFPGPTVFCEPLRGISAPQVQAQIDAWLAEDFPPLETWLAGVPS